MREEETVCVMEAEEAAWAEDARAKRKATKRPNERPGSLIARRAHLKKKAQTDSKAMGTLVAPTGEADKGLEFPEAPCKWCTFTNSSD